MVKKHYFSKIIYLLIAVFVNYSCLVNHIVSKEEITKKDFAKDLKMTLKDGTVYNLHANEFVIENDQLKIKGVIEKTIPLSHIKYFIVSEVDTGQTIFLIGIVCVLVCMFYLGAHYLNYFGDGPIM